MSRLLLSVPDNRRINFAPISGRYSCTPSFRGISTDAGLEPVIMILKVRSKERRFSVCYTMKNKSKWVNSTHKRIIDLNLFHVNVFKINA